MKCIIGYISIENPEDKPMNTVMTKCLSSPALKNNTKKFLTTTSASKALNQIFELNYYLEKYDRMSDIIYFYKNKTIFL